METTTLKEIKRTSCELWINDKKYNVVTFPEFLQLIKNDDMQGPKIIFGLKFKTEIEAQDFLSTLPGSWNTRIEKLENDNFQYGVFFMTKTEKGIFTGKGSQIRIKKMLKYLKKYY